ncbi:hypothetical protein [Salinarchaeum laminariae]|uniref:hypothetical protein n=1 Tax=Salinarchaeum laminariae TaxID=869888 RepID=UPI0020BE53B7|nr:hypothetical protein [Salinarchaeum laminariae]
MPEIGEHYRSDGASVRPGVYRIVGTSDGVTLLRVADDRGRRRHTGEILYVAAATIDEEFEPVGDPDAGFAPRASVRNAIQGLYWSVRSLV